MGEITSLKAHRDDLGGRRTSEDWYQLKDSFIGYSKVQKLFYAVSRT